MRSVGVHRRESTGTGPVALKVVHERRGYVLRASWAENVFPRFGGTSRVYEGYGLDNSLGRSEFIFCFGNGPKFGKVLGGGEVGRSKNLRVVLFGIRFQRPSFTA